MVFVWWARRDLNPQPRDYESPALTVELQAQIVSNHSIFLILRRLIALPEMIFTGIDAFKPSRPQGATALHSTNKGYTISGNAVSSSGLLLRTLPTRSLTGQACMRSAG